MFNDVKLLAEMIRSNVGQVIIGKDDVIELLLIAMLAEGHVLLEDVPGTGKTLLAKSLASSLTLTFKRVQFTPDLLPSDLSGIHYFNQKEADFVFREGPLFTNLLLADEINRATPRTQSALLECMEEKQITVDGWTKKLSKPFFVIATQNPIEQQGTFTLPEAQLDRFLIRISMGYPSHEEGISLLERFMNDDPFASLKAVASDEQLINAAASCRNVKASREVLDYLLNIVEATRNDERIVTGVSPRGSQALLKAAQVKAAIDGREYIKPDDIKALAVPVLSHRITLRGMNRGRIQAESMIEQIVQRVAVPTESELFKA